LKLAAASFSVTVKTAAKWVRRFREGGCTVCRTVARVLVGCAARRLSRRSTRWWPCADSAGRFSDRRSHRPQPGHCQPYPASSQAQPHPSSTSMRLRATCCIWTSRSLDASPAGSSAPPVCERDRVRGGGFEYVHVAIDDHSRIAAATVPSNEQADSAVAALQAALAWYARLGIHCKTVLTDNDPCYRSRQFAQACRKDGIRHRRTRPTRHAPTERQNASSRQPLNGSITTTGIDHTPASTNKPPSADQDSIGTTC
jgi:transposase InsO family protein